LLAVAGLGIAVAAVWLHNPETVVRPVRFEARVPLVDLRVTGAGSLKSARLVLSMPDGTTWAQRQEDRRWVRTDHVSADRWLSLSADGRTTVTVRREPFTSDTSLVRLEHLDHSVGVMRSFRQKPPLGHRSAVASPEGSMVAVLQGEQPHIGDTEGRLDLVPLDERSPVRSIRLTGYVGMAVGWFHPEGDRIVVLGSGDRDTRRVVAGIVDVATGRASRPVEVPGVSILPVNDGGPGWAASPTGTEALLASDPDDLGNRTWKRVSVAVDRVGVLDEFTAPGLDHLISWAQDGTLSWLRPSSEPGTYNIYEIVATDRVGGHAKVQQRLLVPEADMPPVVFAPGTNR
jgi:hypothetical protein